MQTMMKTFLLTGTLMLCSVLVHGQKYMTQSGNVRFFSSTPVEDIEAINNQVSTAINVETGDLVFSLLMTAFTFEKALMQEHFNEKYVESDKYPKSMFKGKVEGLTPEALTAEPKAFPVAGELTMHGVTRTVSTTGSLQKRGAQIVGQCTFLVQPEDFDIKIPGAVRDKIAKEIEITVNAVYDPK